MLNSTTTPAESQADFGEDPAGLAQRWITEIRLYEKKADNWLSRNKRIRDRYRDERPKQQALRGKLNIFWSNIETLKPAVYAKTPKASVSRRFKDNDPVAKVASMLLERSVDYLISCHAGFDDMMRLGRDDYLLFARGIGWQRYTPKLTKVTPEDGSEPYDKLEYEEIAYDYLNPEDFGHNAGARVWAEVYAVWRKGYMSRDELVKRFGEEIGNKIPLDCAGLSEKDSDDRTAELFKKATIYEIWDASSDQTIWIHKEFASQPLDMRPFPLKLQGKFPCPRPMYGTLTSDSLLPVADYTQYQDQAEEIDRLTGRIMHLTKVLKLRGLYAGEINEIKRLFTEANEAELIPVENWAMFADKGGLANAVSWLPIKDVAETLIKLYEARERAKQDLYEVTGLSDILRGASDASETATAQAIKAQWGSIRVREKQTEIQRYARDHVRITAEIVAEQFSPETIVKMANVEAMSPQDQQVVPQAIELLKSDAMRNWRIDIETDSTIEPDEQADKAARNEFLTSVTGFVQAWGPILQQAPQMAPMAGELLKFGVRGFKTGEALESIIDQTMDQLSQAAMQPPQPPEPDPTEVVKAEAEKVRAKADVITANVDMQKAQVEAATMPMKLEAEAQRAASGAMIEQARQMNPNMPQTPRAV